jgi:hypothetical protein
MNRSTVTSPKGLTRRNLLKLSWFGWFTALFNRGHLPKRLPQTPSAEAARERAAPSA